MNNQDLITSITEFSKHKNIDRPTLMNILEDMFRFLVHKKYGPEINFDLQLNPTKGDLKIWHYRTVVADQAATQEDVNAIGLTEARKIEPDFEEGEEVTQEILLSQFERRDIMQGLQVFLQMEQKVEQKKIYDKYKKLVGKIINAEVYHITPYHAILHDSEKNELFLPKSKQIPREIFKKGEPIRALVEEVNPTAHNIRIGLSRTSPFFLEQLLTQEIPEIADGIVQIKKVARIPGVRAKVAVMSQDDRVDAVGACIGAGGNRVFNLGKYELNHEQINVLQYTDKTSVLLRRLIEPAEITGMKEEENQIIVTMRPDQVPLAIGKKGQNIFLVSQIIGKPVQIDRTIPEGQEDIYLTEFEDELDPELIASLKTIGIDTARGVLNAPEEDLLKRTSLSAETLKHMKDIIVKEFKA